MSGVVENARGEELFKYAKWLAILTILYNTIEGLVSIFFGAHDQVLTLFGFGLDSFIEVISGIGVLAMVMRIQANPDVQRSEFEKTALRVTGWSFYLLSLGLLATTAYNLWTGHKPQTTLSGLIISLISIAVMGALVYGKRRVGLSLGSAPILADANCTMICIYMSLVLLFTSLIYGFTGIGFVDGLGAMGLIYFALSEGRESFEKAREMDDATKNDG
jgi:divalent metal cation (Fe/Co/Zn/Cd) transporter